MGYCSDYIRRSYEGRQESPFNKGAGAEGDWGFLGEVLRTLRQDFVLPPPLLKEVSCKFFEDLVNLSLNSNEFGV